MPDRVQPMLFMSAGLHPRVSAIYLVHMLLWLFRRGVTCIAYMQLVES